MGPRLGWSGAHTAQPQCGLGFLTAWQLGSKAEQPERKNQWKPCHLLTWPLQDCGITSPVLCLPPSIHSLNHSPVNILALPTMCKVLIWCWRYRNKQNSKEKKSLT